jgi:hypothetical protein
MEWIDDAVCFGDPESTTVKVAENVPVVVYV